MLPELGCFCRTLWQTTNAVLVGWLSDHKSPRGLCHTELYCIGMFYFHVKLFTILVWRGFPCRLKVRVRVRVIWKPECTCSDNFDLSD